ncbi:GNAT family N-acetyltransferase [Bacillus sp. P14.5]|uniref:GNAT family N-acetyltransferase n=1 Tax=Bacillus sp. P14.5 TaxID=1983400 RepID=UPI000DE93745|nr:GNAT family N-acetyltransferase [Bacillus sp. P14.5]
MIVREAATGDAEKLINLIKEVEASSKFMLMEPGERKTTAEEQRKQLGRIQEQDNATVLVAEKEGRLAGYLFAIGGNTIRTKHSAYIAIGISKPCRGQGAGTLLFKRLEEWAMNHSITRLELTAVTENEEGTALYRKRGFEIEGRKRNSLVIEGSYFDEYYMSKLL